MKYLLILSALIAFTHNCYAQSKLSFEEADSLTRMGILLTIKYDTATHSISYYMPTDTFYLPNNSIIIESRITHNYDTVLVMMLMCDTSQQSVENLGQVYWDIGYEVREVFSSFYTYEGSHVQDFDHINYLDVDKKELPKNIIIWQSKSF